MLKPFPKARISCRRNGNLISFRKQEKEVSMKQEIRDLLQRMHEMGGDVEQCISSLQNAFIYNTPKPLGDCRTTVERFKDLEVELTGKITAQARENPDMKAYISVPVHLLRIAENIEKLSEFIQKKISDKVLFSDRAVTEVTFLLQRLIDIIKPTADIILARNSILSRYVQESEAGVTKRALEYTTLHEERLIEGICAPQASSLYINILDRIKGIAWHAREIATKLA
jgi:Na+/phosphate symporter